MVCYIKEDNLDQVEVIIDRTDRRLLNGKYDSFNTYLMDKTRKMLKEKDRDRIQFITHVDSVYINVMQMSDLIGGAIRDNFTEKNKDLLDVIKNELLIKVP